MTKDRDLFGEKRHTAREVEGEDYAMILIHETHAAILVDTGEKEVWLPKSLIRIETTGKTHMDKKRRVVTPVTVTIPDKLAIEKGIIE